MPIAFITLCIGCVLDGNYFTAVACVLIALTTMLWMDHKGNGYEEQEARKKKSQGPPQL
jgi:hypothetical protein